jgi:hypothetical protein
MIPVFLAHQISIIHCVLKNHPFVAEKSEEYVMKGFPAIYMIDCTSNECHHLLKSAGMVVFIF